MVISEVVAVVLIGLTGPREFRRAKIALDFTMIECWHEIACAEDMVRIHKSKRSGTLRVVCIDKLEAG